MPVRRLPPNPSLDHVKYQAKDLRKAHAARDRATAQRIREFHPRFAGATDAQIFSSPFRLSDAQLTIAREAGFPGWPRLKRHIEKPALADKLDLPYHERIEDPVFRHAVDLVDAGDAAGLRAHLARHPGLAKRRVLFEGGNYFRNPSLLEFIAENPIRRGKLPENIREIAQVILDAGVGPSAIDETLGLVATGRIARECGMQLSLIALLCDHGAETQRTLQAAVAHGEFEAARALIARGARVTLPIAAALGDLDEARRLMSSGDGHQRHLALALAAQFGHVEIVRLLLDAGEDPNRYNPPGSHSHSTPLHQAAGAGHEAVVRLLVERGARLDLKDVLWNGTPAGWARHGGWTQLAEYLEQDDGRQHPNQKPK